LAIFSFNAILVCLINYNNVRKTWDRFTFFLKTGSKPSNLCCPLKTFISKTGGTENFLSRPSRPASREIWTGLSCPVPFRLSREFVFVRFSSTIDFLKIVFNVITTHYSISQVYLCLYIEMRTTDLQVIAVSNTLLTLSEKVISYPEYSAVSSQ
jgi:hypothetical protein